MYQDDNMRLVLKAASFLRRPKLESIVTVETVALCT